MEDLARISLKKAPLYVGVDDHKENSTVDGLEQVRVVKDALQEISLTPRVHNKRESIERSITLHQEVT